MGANTPLALGKHLEGCQGGSGDAPQLGAWPGEPTTEDCKVPTGRPLQLHCIGSAQPSAPSHASTFTERKPQWMGLTGASQDSSRQLQTQSSQFDYTES